MRACLRFIMILLAITAVSMPAMAAETRGTKEDAKALVAKAIGYFKTNGKDKTIAEVNSPTGQLTDRDLYIFILDMDGMRLAHGTNQKLVGKSIIGFKDVDGKTYGDEIVQKAKADGSGWVDYKFTDPQTKKIGEKTTYLQREGNLIFCAGAYK